MDTEAYDSGAGPSARPSGRRHLELRSATHSLHRRLRLHTHDQRHFRRRAGADAADRGDATEGAATTSAGQPTNDKRAATIIAGQTTRAECDALAVREATTVERQGGGARP